MTMGAGGGGRGGAITAGGGVGSRGGGGGGRMTRGGGVGERARRTMVMSSVEGISRRATRAEQNESKEEKRACYEFWCEAIA